MYSDGRISIPIRHVTNDIQSRDTTVQWIEDPRTGQDIYRMRIYIEGFHRNEVNARVEGRRIFIYGERIENKNQVRRNKFICLI